jgi:chaperonin cofactor prefoldin
VLADRDATISELQETNEILELKVRKLEQLVRLKDAKIQTLMAKLQTAERTT